MRRESPREIAIRVLRRQADGQDYVEKLLEEELDRASLGPLDRGLCHELVCGLVRWQRTLDWLIARKTDGRPQKGVLQLLLRLGLYQMFWLERIPAHAAVHETVELGKALGCGQQAGFLNAVLRGYGREREATLERLQALKRSEPALGYSHPSWLVERWQARWGAEKTAQLLEWNNSRPPTFARVNELKTDGAKLAAAWTAAGVGFAPRQWDWTGANAVYELKSHPSLADWSDFQQGLFYIQDPSTLLAVRELDPQPGETILDLCAAPGGKTTLIAQHMQNRGRIVARDNQPERVLRLQENCARLGATCVETTEASGDFDRVLVDAPCSNSGVLRRRVDLRWRIREEEIARLRNTQGALLHQAAAQVKRGGTLVYSTCSLEPEENEMVTEEFLRDHADFTLEKQRQVLPFIEGVDGAYVARMRRGA